MGDVICGMTKNTMFIGINNTRGYYNICKHAQKCNIYTSTMNILYKSCLYTYVCTIYYIKRINPINIPAFRHQ